MKKVISILTAAVMLLSLFTTVAFAATTVSVTAGEATVDGANVSVPIIVSSSDGTSQVGFAVTYDTEDLTYVSTSTNLAARNYSVNTKTAGKVILKSIVDVDDPYEDEELFVVNFTVADGVASTDVGVEWVKNSMADIEAEMIKQSDVTFTGTTITFAAPSVTYDVEAVAELEDVSFRDGDTAADITLPATVEVTYNTDQKATAAIAWPADFTVADGAVIEGDLDLTGIDISPDTIANGNNLKASVKLAMIDESLSLTANGKAAAEYYNALNTAVTVKAVYGNAANAEYVFVESDSIPATAPADGWSASDEYVYAGAAEESTVFVTVFVRDGESVKSEAVKIINKESTYAAGIYVNATPANPTYSAFRVNLYGPLTITGSLEDLNGETVDGAEYKYYILNKDKTVAKENSTGVFADISDLKDRTNYYAKIALVDGDKEIASAEKIIYVADFSVWFTEYTVYQFDADKDALANKSGVTLNKNLPVKSEIVYDAGTPDGEELVASYKLTAYADANDVKLEGDGMTANLVYAEELDFAAVANGSYTLYQMAKMDAAQNYYDMTFGKTVYVFDKTAQVCNLLLNGSTGCAVGKVDTMTVKAKWSDKSYEAKAPAGLKYKYDVYAYGSDDVVATATVDSNVEATLDISALPYKNKVVLTVILPDGTEEETLTKIFYR